MALSAHLKQLNNKHAKLDEQIENLMKQPAPDTILITDLKKQKLQLKEKISHMQSG